MLAELQYLLLFASIIVQIHSADLHVMNSDHLHKHDHSLLHTIGITTQGFRYVYIAILFIHLVVERYKLSSMFSVFISVGSVVLASLSIYWNDFVRQNYIPTEQYLSNLASGLVFGYGLSLIHI